MAYVCYDCKIILPSEKGNCPSCGGRICLDEKTDADLENEGFTSLSIFYLKRDLTSQISLLQDLSNRIPKTPTVREGGPKKAVCANCGKDYISGDKYCRFCGAPMGSPSFIPDSFAQIYGPRPIVRVHTCADCGFSWETMEMVDDARWCPRCGGTAPAVKVDIRRRTAPAIDALEEDES